MAGWRDHEMNAETLDASASHLAEGDDKEEQVNELIALEAIYENEDLEICSHDNAKTDLPGGIFNIPIFPPQPFAVEMKKGMDGVKNQTYARTRGRGRGCYAPKNKRKPEKERRTSCGSDEAPQAERVTLYPIKRLPPITLTFAFPFNYPTVATPKFTLSCCWLDRMQLSSLCQKLDEIWEECKGTVVVMNWVTFLQEEAILFLGIESPYNLACVLHHNNKQEAGEFEEPPWDEPETPPRLDCRGFHNFQSLEEVLPRVLDFNLVTCEICFEEKAGTEFLRLINCSEHLTCRECMKGWVEARIAEGGVIDLKCPGYKCEKSLLPTEVASVVSEEMFQHYDKLLLKTAFDVMTDVLHCPRTFCQFPVVLEDNLGFCQKCHHAFCARCQNTYHGHSPCKMKGEMFGAISKEYETCSLERRHQLEMMYGKQMIRRALDETKSNQWLESNSKQCPNCSTFIQKNDGCNKMTCTNCRTFFCWLCQAELSRSNPYFHYQHPTSPCTNRLFEGMDMEEVDWEDAVLVGMEEIWVANAEGGFEDADNLDYDDEDDDVEFQPDKL